MMLDALVIGGGLAGLEAALTLREQGCSVQLLEASDRAGGVVGTRHRDGYRMEMSAHTLRAGGAVLTERLEQFAIPTQTVGREVARQRAVLTDSGLHAFSGPGDIMRSPLLGLAAKARILLEPFVGPASDPNETLEQFMVRRLGQQAGRLCAPLCARGVYAAPADRLAARTAFPRLWSMDQSGGLLRGAGRAKGGGILHVQGGLGRLPEAIAAQLGSSLSLQSTVQSVEPCEQGWRAELGARSLVARSLIVATPVAVAVRLLGSAAPRVSGLLAEIDEQWLQVVHLGFARRQAPEGFGFLVHPRAGGALLGCIYASRINADVAPPEACLLSCLVGACDDPVAEARAGLAKALAWRDEPTLVETIAPTHGLPLYGALHGDLEQRLSDSLLAHEGLALAGNYIAGISVDQTMTCGRNAAHSILRATAQRKVA